MLGFRLPFARRKGGGLGAMGGGIGTAAWYLAGGISPSNCVAAYKPLGAASPAESYINLANPGTYTAAPGVIPFFTPATGWRFNGTTEYLTTGLVPTNAQTWSMVCRFSAVNGTGGILLGSNSSGPARWLILQPNRADNKVGYFSGGELDVAPGLTSGVMGLAGNQAFRNGVAEAGTIPAANGTLTAMFIGCENSGGTPLGFIKCDIQAAAVYNTTLTNAQMSAVATAMAALPAGNDLGTALTAMPLAKAQFGFEACNGKLYAVGGDKNAAVGTAKKLYAYDPDANTWATLTDIPIATAERQSLAFRAVGTKLYAIGGLDQPSTLEAEVYEYDTINGSWSAKTAMPTAREDFGSAVVNGLIYCFGGLNATGNAGTIATMEVYNPATDTWDVTKASMPDTKALGDFGAAYNGKIYAVGSQNTMAGYPNLSPNTTVYEYTVATDTWAAKATIPVSTCYKEVEVIGSNLYVIGGFATSTSGPASQDIYKYDTLTDTWSYYGAAPYRAGQIGMAALNGILYLCGGYNGSAYFDSLYSIRV